MPTPVCITSKHLCTAGLYAAHDPYHIRTLRLLCVKLSPTCHAALGRCGEARDEATHLHDLVSSSLVYTVFVSKAPIHAFRGGDRVQKVGGLNKSFLYTKAKCPKCFLRSSWAQTNSEIRISYILVDVK